MNAPARVMTLALAAGMAVLGSGSALGATQISQLPGPTGSVNAISEPDSNGVRYIGGDFTMFNVWDTGSGAAFTAGSSIPNTDFPKVSGGEVRAAAGDGSGGFYIGGAFNCIGAINGDGDCTDAGEYARSRLAHILADGSVDPAWAPGVNNAVNAIAVSGSTVYVGGGFTTAGSGGSPPTRNRLAAFDATTGALADWNPNPNNTVQAIVVSGSTVYVGGDFGAIGAGASSALRYRLAAVDATSGALAAWNPSVGGTVYAIALSGSTVYFGGSFTQVGLNPVTRNRIAAVDATTGALTAWNPGADMTVKRLAVSGSTVYAGGDFSSIGGQSRSALAALDATANTNNATAWDPNVGSGSSIFTLAVSGSTVYVGGNFTSIGGQSRNRIAALDATVNTNNATAWNPNANGNVSLVAVSGPTVYAGGTFNAIGGQPRARLAAIDADGYLTDWNPGANGGVKNILVDGSTVFIGGEFSSVASSTRRGLAAVGTDGTLSTWNPSLNNGGSVRDVVKVGTDLFFGGYFSAIGGVTRGNIGAVSLAGSCATTFTDACVKSWNPATTTPGRGADVNTLYQSGSTMLVGGPFSAVSAVTREGAAAVGIDSTCLDAYTSACVRSWNPDFNERVNALEVLGDVAYMSGWFGTASGSSRTKLAAVKVDSPCITSWSSGSCLTAWNPTAGNAVNALAISGTTLYAGGPFQTFAGTARNRVASVDLSGACATTFSAPCLGSWNPDAGGEVRTLRAAGSNVYIGGDFTTLGSAVRHRLAVIGADGTLGPAIGGDRPTEPSPPTSVAVTESGQVATVTFQGAFNGGSAVTAYTATCASSTGGATRTGTGASSPLTVTGLSPGATYTCTVSATNALGTSAASAASAAFTVTGGGSAPAESGASGSGSPAGQQASQSSGQSSGVPRLGLRRPPQQAPDGRFVTVGIVPAGATTVVQIARSGRTASSLSRAPRAAARVATNCPITTAGTTRTFTCRTRLGTGAWTLITEARAGSTVVASISRRVVVKAARRTAVTG